MGLQPTVIAAIRPTLEAREGFEPSISGLQPDAFPLGYRVWHRCRELNPRSRVWSPLDHRWLTCWLREMDSNHRDLLQRQADYHYLISHGCGPWIRTTVTTFKESQPTAS